MMQWDFPLLFLACPGFLAAERRQLKYRARLTGWDLSGRQRDSSLPPLCLLSFASHQRLGSSHELLLLFGSGY